MEFVGFRPVGLKCGAGALGVGCVGFGWHPSGMPFTPEAWERIARGAKRPRVRVGKG